MMLPASSTLVGSVLQTPSRSAFQFFGAPVIKFPVAAPIIKETVKDAACKVVVGPTVGLVPDAYLRRGCDILGSIRVTDADNFLDVLAEGGSGYHFFGKSAQKIVLRSGRQTGWRANQDAIVLPSELVSH
jgi:hypothetical protein